VTKLGRLVKERKITNLHDVYYHALPIKEYQIIDRLFPAETLKDEVIKIMPVQKQTAAGQRTKFKAYVAIGDRAGHVGLGMKTSKEVATAIRGAIIDAKMNIIPVRRGFWGNRVGAPHTVPMKVTGKSGSVVCRLIPAPRGTGLVAAPTPKKLLQLAGVEDVYANTRGSTKTQGNFITACYLALAEVCGARATRRTERRFFSPSHCFVFVFVCLVLRCWSHRGVLVCRRCCRARAGVQTYGYLSPDFWKVEPFAPSPYQEFTDFLAGKAK